MNLEQATPQQRSVITTLDKPLMVAAGAGSGKTFTLTQRVVYALLPGVASDNAYLGSIDEVLATTFTKKAANELKYRIKKLLLSEGLVNDALKVDKAWISTIHGICTKILKENAFELGIDPSFKVVEEKDEIYFLDQAFEEIVFQVRESDDKRILSLLETYPVIQKASNNNAIDLYGMTRQIISKALATKEGFDSVVICSEEVDFGSALRRMVEFGEMYFEVEKTWTKSYNADPVNHTSFESAIKLAHNYFDACPVCSLGSESFDPESFLRVFYSFPKLPLNYHKTESKEFVEEYLYTYAELSAQVNQAIGGYFARILVDFAQLVYERYFSLKGSSLLDNTDLLRMTAQALEDHPEIAKAYRRRFSMIMIDEFQDTDQLQVELLSSLLRDDASNICTVGDAQQSIYRFRGADVSVFHEFRKSIKQTYPEAQLVSLPDNFRSHRDILSFVDFIFSHPRFFGEEFLSLSPRSFINNEEDAVFADRARIRMQLVIAQKDAKIEDARRYSAAKIAQHFAELRAEGVPPEDMVVLFGGMTNAGIYADALRAEGFESIVTGGSIFTGAIEVDLVADLLHICVNPHDALSLYKVLTSDLFTFSDATLLALASTWENNRAKRQDLAWGFLYSDEEKLQGISDEEQSALHHARACIKCLIKEATTTSVVLALKRFFVSCGYFSYLEQWGAEGLSVAGNIYKALEIIAELEVDGSGPSLVSRFFDEKLSTAKEAPGRLSTSSAGSVRMMTVHASKGLEFPHVALAEMSMGKVKDSQFCIESSQGQTKVVLKPKLIDPPKKTSDGLKKLLEKSDFSERKTSASLLKETRAQKELEEAQRLLYVALTRASKSLFVTFNVKGNLNDTFYENKGLLRDLFDVVRWNHEELHQEIPYGGDMPLDFSFVCLTEPFEGMNQDQEDDAGSVGELDPQGQGCDTLTDGEHDSQNQSGNACAAGLSAGHDAPQESSDAVPGMHFDLHMPEQSAPTYVLPQETGQGVASYSSLAQAKETKGHLEKETAPASVSPDEEDVCVFGLSASRDEALEFGTFFHRSAQKCILEARAQKDRLSWLKSLDPSEYTHKLLVTKQHSLSFEERFIACFSSWMERVELKEMLSCDDIDAEVPFLVELPSDALDEPRYLEGEIDALGQRSTNEAFFIDYKTGGSVNESEEQVYQKHLLQAQCYAYALLRQGYEQVKGTFVRVELLTEPDQSCAKTMTYSFSSADISALESAILQAF